VLDFRSGMVWTLDSGLFYIVQHLATALECGATELPHVKAPSSPFHLDTDPGPGPGVDPSGRSCMKGLNAQAKTLELGPLNSGAELLGLH
jgi:hypothetical protein